MSNSAPLKHLRASTAFLGVISGIGTLSISTSASAQEPKFASASREEHALIEACLRVPACKAEILATIGKHAGTLDRDGWSNALPTDGGGVSESKPTRTHQRITITIADFILDQLERKGCWGDQEDMADARRLRATFRIRFDKDGSLLEEPQMVVPAHEPARDQPMQIFVQRARRALSMCSPFTVPKEYYETVPAQWIHIEFLP